jgi:hypothetical protein
MPALEDPFSHMSTLNALLFFVSSFNSIFSPTQHKTGGLL